MARAQHSAFERPQLILRGHTQGCCARGSAFEAQKRSTLDTGQGKTLCVPGWFSIVFSVMTMQNF